jgi:S-formylglutathione hydrolase FrmB
MNLKINKMKKLNLFFLILFSGLYLNLNAQYLKLDATFYSESLDQIKNVDVYLPSDYFQNDTVYYPVIYFLHGANGNQNDYGNLAIALYAMIMSGDIHPFILVKPDGSCEPYLGSYYTNSALYGNYEDFIVRDVVSFIERNFRADTNRYARYIAGHSMGGGGSFVLSIKYPKLYRGILASSYHPCGDLILEPWKERLYLENDSSYHFSYNAGNYTKLYYTSCGAWSPNLDMDPPFEPLIDTNGNWVDSVLAKHRLHDPARTIHHLTPEDNLAFYFTCGTNDEFGFYPANLAFVDTLTKFGFDFKFRPYVGTHAHDVQAFMDGYKFIDSLYTEGLLYAGITDQPYETFSFQLYPNPCTKEITLSFPKFQFKKAELIITDISGNPLIRKYFSKSDQQKSIQVSLSDYPPGIYFLRLQAGNEMVTKKVVKL